MYEEQVSKGLALLADKQVKSINLDMLDMCYNCIVQQLYKDYGNGLAELGISGEGIINGFFLDRAAYRSYAVFQKHMVVLRDEWKRQISERLKGVND